MIEVTADSISSKEDVGVIFLGNMHCNTAICFVWLLILKLISLIWWSDKEGTFCGILNRATPYISIVLLSLIYAWYKYSDISFQVTSSCVMQKLKPYF